MNTFHYMTLTELFIIKFEDEKSKSYIDFHFASTDPKILDWLTASVEASSFFKLGSVGTFPSGGKYSVSVTDVPNKESTKIKWWFLSQLGQMGWEPFAIEKPYPEPRDDSSDVSRAKNILAIGASITEISTIHLRKREDTQTPKE